MVLSTPLPVTTPCALPSPQYAIVVTVNILQTLGAPVISCLRKAQKGAFIDCHLMVKEPATLVEPLKKAGASSLTFHLESDMPEGGVPAMIKMIRDAGMNVGIVIKPDTPVDTVFPYVSVSMPSTQ